MNRFNTISLSLLLVCSSASMFGMQEQSQSDDQAIQSRIQETPALAQFEEQLEFVFQNIPTDADSSDIAALIETEKTQE